jgi:hypothetical protein
VAKITFRTKVKAFREFEGMHYLEVPKSQVKKLGGKFFVRLVCTVNGKVRFQCGLMGLGGGAGYITFTKARMKELGVAKESAVKVELAPDKSEYGLPMPEELEELLRQDGEGRRRFDLLSDGKKRNILHYVGSPKDTDKRLDRAVVTIENLKRLPEGKETVRAIFNIRGNFNRQS